MRLALLIFVALLANACAMKNAKYDKAFVDMDSLVTEQVAALVKAKAVLSKKAKIKGEEDETQFTPDSLEWANELDVFRQLDIINKPTFRQMYDVHITQDTQSNLTVLALTGKQPVAIPYINFYFLNRLDNLKKVKSEFVEANTLFTSVRYLEMVFENENNKPLLTGYSVEGGQKMIVGDSVQYSIRASVQPLH